MWEVRAMALADGKTPEKVGNAIGTVIAALIVADLLYALLTHFV
jgi:hypothetical protein